MSFPSKHLSWYVLVEIDGQGKRQDTLWGSSSSQGFFKGWKRTTMVMPSLCPPSSSLSLGMRIGTPSHSSRWWALVVVCICNVLYVEWGKRCLSLFDWLRSCSCKSLPCRKSDHNTIYVLTSICIMYVCIFAMPKYKFILYFTWEGFYYFLDFCRCIIMCH
jgi:hypothetical protein